MAPKLMDFSHLSLSERLQLVEDLWDSIDDEQIPVPEWHLQELERRLAEFRANPEAGAPWAEVRERLYKLIR
jgi:putative addiction module component (TIGR02574 family)